MTQSVFLVQPDRIQRRDVAVMEQTTVDELSSIQALWPSFEQLVGLRGRKMYARINEHLNTYTVCTPLDHSPMRSLLDKGCTDAAEATGKGLRGTWPAAFPWPLTIPIDHVLLNRRAGTVTGFEVLDIGGTDHLGLVAVIAP